MRTEPARVLSLGRLGWLLLIVPGLAGCVFFVVTHPFAVWAAIGVALYAVVLAVRREAWLLALPALLPVIDLVPYTGMIHFAESDALVFATLTVVGLQAMFDRRTAATRGRSWRFGPIQWVLVLLAASSYVISTDWQAALVWFRDPYVSAGYLDPTNGVRLAKGFFFAVLLIPLLSHSFTMDGPRAADKLTLGVLLGLASVAAAGVWERVAYVGLSDFASDYRITALFWETNVGGAALDGWLALGFPVLVWALLRARSRIALCLTSALLVVVAYVVFVTFSRGLYAGVLLGSVMVALFSLVRSGGEIGAESKRDLFVQMAWAVVIVLACAFIFSLGGFRGVLATVTAAFGVWLAAPLVRERPLRLLIALPFGLLGLGLSVLLLIAVPKGVYLGHALGGVAMVVVAMGALRRGGSEVFSIALIAASLWLVSSASLVSAYWGEWESVFPVVLAPLLLVLPLIAAPVRGLVGWQFSFRGTVLTTTALVMVAGLAVAANSYYAGARFDAVAEDLEGRKAHWSASLDLTRSSSSPWFGVGTGRFAEHFLLVMPERDRQGGHAFFGAEDGTYLLRLGEIGARMGYGELFRVSQRVSSDLVAPFAISVEGRAIDRNAGLHVELCRKHILYDLYRCSHERVAVPVASESQPINVTLPALRLGKTSGLFRSGTVFSIANRGGGMIELSSVSVMDSSGRELVANGDFANGTQRWFFTSDRHHLPWHAKNLGLHLLVEQGWLGLAAFSALLIGAVFRLTLGGAAHHPLAPPLIGALVGIVVVGMFDSLIDVPRLTLMMCLMMFLALGLKSLPLHRV